MTDREFEALVRSEAGNLFRIAWGILGQEADAWAAEGTLPEAKLAALLRPVRRHRRIRSALTALATAAASLLLLLTIPQVRVWAANTAAELPVIGDFIRRMAVHDPMWSWAEQHDAFQEVIAETAGQGYTVRLHKVLADPTQTTVVFTVAGQQPMTASPDLYNLGVMLLADGKPFDTRMAVRPQAIDGVLVVALETGPLPSEQARLTLHLFRVLDMNGEWKLEARVSRKALSELPRTVPINKDVQVGPVTLRIGQVVISPAQTVVQMTGPAGGFDPFGDGFRTALLADGSPLPLRNESGRGDGGPLTYTLDFGPLPQEARALTLQIDGFLMQSAVSTVVPLAPGAAIQAEGGWPLQVDAASRAPNGGTEVTLSYPHDEQDPWRPYDDWAWIDQVGALHPIKPTLVCQQTAPRCLLRFSMLPKEGQVPVQLQADTAWIKVQGPWTIPLAEAATAK